MYAPFGRVFRSDWVPIRALCQDHVHNADEGPGWVLLARPDCCVMSVFRGWCGPEEWRGRHPGVMGANPEWPSSLTSHYVRRHEWWSATLEPLTCGYTWGAAPWRCNGHTLERCGGLSRTLAHHRPLLPRRPPRLPHTPLDTAGAGPPTHPWCCLSPQVTRMRPGDKAVPQTDRPPRRPARSNQGPGPCSPLVLPSPPGPGGESGQGRPAGLVGGFDHRGCGSRHLGRSRLRSRPAPTPGSTPCCPVPGSDSAPKARGCPSVWEGPVPVLEHLRLDSPRGDHALARNCRTDVRR
ncbi:hypothetical protein CLV63_11936 [Murinocardiopsis flavida]|uniref:Uncharacterized protein n=1 Tax=Murinocardiopsis flavida TaxID=645275 RepID=A0A2P8D3F5_9ACTN|nr:hypothetical protein CLV63_11936 [Murinocardiopsis flavida]